MINLRIRQILTYVSIALTVRYINPENQSKISTEFFVTVGSIQGLDMVEIIGKYLAPRPQHTNHGRLFVGYRQGFYTIQPVGIHMFGSMSKNITTFLNLSHPKEYTGHSFKRSCTSMLAVSGTDLLTVKHHVGWKSNAVAEV
ncbi:hypothetical protein Zmor_020724 [Zophobas morio]|uniref:Tyr recombinase domain-containing protein n=1 Tax=Zophobas morio TaxID=2755281 RepID=A0AA38I855_9CUCU|nr:hypothetical protein Zmor_020724 [Zophobas morio]